MPSPRTCAADPSQPHKEAAIESRHRPANRVLIVEPHDDSRELCAEYFAWAGVHVVAVPTAADALRMAGLESPDVLITCLRLPDGDGFALLDALRATPHGDPIRAIALSTSQQDHERGVSDPRFEAVLMKPCLPEVLVGLVHEALTAENIRQMRTAQLAPGAASHGVQADGTSPTETFRGPRLTVRPAAGRNKERHTTREDDAIRSVATTRASPRDRR